MSCLINHVHINYIIVILRFDLYPALSWPTSISLLPHKNAPYLQEVVKETGGRLKLMTSFMWGLCDSLCVCVHVRVCMYVCEHDVVT